MKKQPNSQLPANVQADRRNSPRPSPEMLKAVEPCLAQLKQQIAQRQSMA